MAIIPDVRELGGEQGHEEADEQKWAMM